MEKQKQPPQQQPKIELDTQITVPKSRHNSGNPKLPSLKEESDEPDDSFLNESNSTDIISSQLSPNRSSGYNTGNTINNPSNMNIERLAQAARLNMVIRNSNQQAKDLDRELEQEQSTMRDHQVNLDQDPSSEGNSTTTGHENGLSSITKSNTSHPSCLKCQKLNRKWKIKYDRSRRAKNLAIQNLDNEKSELQKEINKLNKKIKIAENLQNKIIDRVAENGYKNFLKVNRAEARSFILDTTTNKSNNKIIDSLEEENVMLKMQIEVLKKENLRQKEESDAQLKDAIGRYFSSVTNLNTNLSNLEDTLSDIRGSVGSFDFGGRK